MKRKAKRANIRENRDSMGNGLEWHHWRFVMATMILLKAKQLQSVRCGYRYMYTCG